MVVKSGQNAMPPPEHCFGPFVLDVRQGFLLHDRQKVSLGKQAVLLLQVFLENRDRVLSHDFLLDKAWTDSTVTSSTVIEHVRQIRKALKEYDYGDCIHTWDRRGYSFYDDRLASSASIPAEQPKSLVW